MAKVITALVLFACALAAPQALAQSYEPNRKVYADANKLRQEAQTLYMDAEKGKALAEQLAETARITEQRARRLRAMAAPASEAADEMYELSTELTGYQEKMNDNFREPAEVESVTIHAHGNEEEWVRGMNSLFFGFSQEMSASADDFWRRADKLSEGANIIINAADAEKARAEMMFERAQAISANAGMMQQDADIKNAWAGALTSLVGDWQCEGDDADKERFSAIWGENRFKDKSILVQSSYHFSDDYKFEKQISHISSFTFTRGDGEDFRITLGTEKLNAGALKTSLVFKVDVTLTAIFSSSGNWGITAHGAGTQLTLTDNNSNGLWKVRNNMVPNSEDVDFNVDLVIWSPSIPKDWRKDPDVVEKMRQYQRKVSQALARLERSHAEIPPLPPLAEDYTWKDWQNMCNRDVW